MSNGDLIFADTSALLALLDGDDINHDVAFEEWKKFSETQEILFSSDYVRLESSSLIQRRLGAAALCDFHDAFLPLIKILPVGENGFELAFEKWRLAQRRHLSLVDITSFDCMRREGISRVYSFDRHFAEQGFQLCPYRSL
jgi:predicted nucleic acid-binding protein